MDVRDQALKVDQARDRYREAQEDLKNSYDKNLKQTKETFDNRIEKQSKNYAEHKSKLEEENQVNNELYTEKTRSAIKGNQEAFKNRLREQTAKFDAERTNSKNDLNEKLSGLSESYKKSFDENNRYNDQIKKTMGERYTNANKNYQSEFNKQIDNMTNKVNADSTENRANERAERMNMTQKYSADMENLRSASNEQKFKEVNRLRADNENLRTTLGRENDLLKDRQEDRVAELLKLKNKEGDDSMKNFESLQQNIRQKNVQEQEKLNLAQSKESKDREKKFNEDVRNIQSIANQKVKGGTSADTLHDELKQTKSSYESRLEAARAEMARNSKYSTEKEESIDLMYRDKLKEAKTAGVENLAKNDAEANDVLKKTVYENREKNNALIDRFKQENGTLKKDNEDRLSHAGEQSKNKIKEQRVEFGRVVNTLNDKNMETINALKEDYSKDKSHSIEKSKKEFNEEKMAMKNEFNRQSTIRDSLYEQKFSELEKQTQKIVDNYENRLAQVARKAETEIAAVKSKEEGRKMKELQANALAFDGLRQQNDNELVEMRDKYEGTIAKNQALSEQKNNMLVQRYEDQLNRERNNSQKELSVRLGESQAQFERLFKSSEMEKETLRNQYEQRIENMKLASLAQDHSKKA